MLLATALALLITGCAQQTFTVQNKPAAVAPKETITHHFFVSGIGQKKTVDAAKICGGAENVVKTETQQTFVNGLLGFITRHLLRWKRVCIAHNNCMSCPSIWATLSTLLINILLGSFQLFLHGDQPSLGASNPVQQCLPVERAALSTPEAMTLHALTTDCFDVQPTTTSGNIITQSIIFGFSIANSSCILHRAQQHHADASACQ